MISNQIAKLIQESQELDDIQIQVKDKSLDLITSLFFEMGGAIMALKMETSQLLSSITLLDSQVTEMKLKCISELDSLIDNHQQQFNLVSKKIESLVEGIGLIKFKTVNNNQNMFFVSEMAISSLNALQQDISECSVQPLKKCLEVSTEKEENKIIILKHPAQFPQAEALSLINEESILKKKTQKLTEEYRILESKIFPLRETNATLMHAQKNTISFHQENLEKIRKKCESSLNKLLELVMTAKKVISWETLITFNASIIRYDILPAKTAQIYKSRYDDEAKIMNGEFQSKMESIVSSVEGFINLQKLSKEGTKS